jgi:hypothetical protein
VCLTIFTKAREDALFHILGIQNASSTLKELDNVYHTIWTIQLQSKIREVGSVEHMEKFPSVTYLTLFLCKTLVEILISLVV